MSSGVFGINPDKYGPNFRFEYPWNDGYTGSGSGISPTGFLHHVATHEDIDNDELVDDFQKNRLHGYTVRELIDLGVCTGRILKPATPIAPIHPIFAPCMWEVHGDRPATWTVPMPSPNATPAGDWVFSNPDIANVMQPVLVLASLLLANAKIVPFFDALLCGPLLPLDQNTTSVPITPDQNFTTFWKRQNPQYFNECRQKFDLALRNLACNLKWGFMESHKGLWDNVPVNDSYAVTYRDVNSAGDYCVWIHINQDNMSALMRGDLTSAEKAGTEYTLACIILHELTHALWMQIRPRMGHPEPYYEMSPQSELGFEMEAQVLGGVVEPSVHAPYAALAYTITTSYPSFKDIRTRNGHTPVRDRIFGGYRVDNTRYWMSAQVFEDIRQFDFWNQGVRHFGLDFLHVRALKFGYRGWFIADWQIQDAWGAPQITSSGVGRVELLRLTVQKAHDKAVHSIRQLQNVTPQNKSAYDFANQLLTSAEREYAFYTDYPDVDMVQEKIRSLFRDMHVAERTQNITAKDNTVREIMLKIYQSVTDHKSRFEALLAAEGYTGHTYRDRRINFIRWNIGTRRLLNSILSDMPNPEQVISLPQMRLPSNQSGRRGNQPRGRSASPNSGNRRGSRNRSSQPTDAERRRQLERERDVKVAEQKRTHLHELLRKLEFVRMNIYPPLPNWRNLSDAERNAELQQWPDHHNLFRTDSDDMTWLENFWNAADNDTDDARELAEVWLESAEGLSTRTYYTRCVAMYMREVTHPDFGDKSFNSRSFVTNKAIEELKEIRDGSSRFWWRGIDQWMEFFNDFGQLVDPQIDVRMGNA